MDDIFLAFVARLAGFLGRGLAAERDIVVIGDGLSIVCRGDYVPPIAYEDEPQRRRGLSSPSGSVP